jgi:hypothetical protein
MEESIPRYERIEAASVEKHEEALFTQLLDVQFRYADILYGSEEGKNESEDFVDFLKKYSVVNELALKEPYATELRKIHDQRAENWTSQSIEVVLKAFADLGLRLTRPRGTERKSFGLIEYENPKKVPQLEKYGIAATDDVIEIHGTDAFKKPDSPAGAGKALARLAEEIVDRYPQTRYILGKSWLIDTPLAENIGFKKIHLDEEDMQKFRHGLGFWMQFINKDGQIDQGRLQHLMETGQAPHEYRIGYMPIEKFLYRFLPKSKRGEVTLKEFKDGSYVDKKVTIPDRKK